MTALSVLQGLPDWPARMKAPVAAAYMGVSQTTFLERFGAVGVKDGGNTFWARAQLDRIIANQFGLSSQSVAAVDDDPYLAWKAQQGN
ncbi:hypothetical protein [Sphingomonas sp. Leaf4]|uniref:hypothetical protein n=1 Tax=Sphingomonas sp. Leaf4 TaxID=2876553 RepID=UPI001E56EE58|nr:hypothetical protein [Sphingomonas sp. Leaf4]